MNTPYHGSLISSSTMTEILDDERDSIHQFFLRCVEDENKQPWIAFRLPDGRVAMAVCTITVKQNG